MKFVTANFYAYTQAEFTKLTSYYFIYLSLSGLQSCHIQLFTSTALVSSDFVFTQSCTTSSFLKYHNSYSSSIGYSSLLHHWIPFTYLYTKWEINKWYKDLPVHYQSTHWWDLFIVAKDTHVTNNSVSAKTVTTVFSVQPEKTLKHLHCGDFLLPNCFLTVFYL